MENFLHGNYMSIIKEELLPINMKPGCINYISENSPSEHVNIPKEEFDFLPLMLLATLWKMN